MRFSSIVSIFVLCSAYTLGDRLLLEINDYSYTQRQLEAHFLVQETIWSDYEKEIINARDWVKLLNIFREDMLILLEAERYGWHRPTERDIELARQNILKNQTRIQSEFIRLGIDKDMLTDIIIANLKINSYRKNQKSESKGKKPEWLLKLERKSFIRFYRDSSTYFPIFPSSQR